MKYEIMKDKEDLYVLSINNIVVLISRNIGEITTEIQEDAKNRLISPKRTYTPAIINAKSPNNTPQLIVIGKLPKKDIKPKPEITDNALPLGSLGKLFGL